ncbi:MULTISPECIES: hypothetical protein [Klebsiella pneumoniae complex]|uniref:hypothetical protein n=1 Tax=Klebsiella pneumoniae complex TaxID=3390273 RepID=UPI0015618378|nr:MULTISPECIES: hypothetical protein [Klebsiella]HCI6019901.1 hypothetical protein [Klebsiella quasipneumoniae subsp. quasipneumoniae]HCM6936247.1 hypothetical protein [Klebsiella quasipneumoniae subsp. similipneumoniae]MDE8419294.1 hypothetical protein [Klebsiella pneumoniae]MDO0834366.1 hypothetical protein [Klebsiella pneumoniae]NRG07507.1 hypothetical protein [Klebsiella variicola]
MTKSTITRNELNEVIATYGKSHLAHRMATVLLAAMDNVPGKIIEVNVGGNTWVQCSEKAFENAKSKGELTRVLYEYPSAAVFLKD